MRGADAVPPGLTCSLPAIWKGLLYDAQARADAWERVSVHPLAAREAARVDSAQRGLAARYGDEPVIELARDLAQISRDGLRRIAHAGRRDRDETGFLDPVFEQIALGQSPGQVIGVADLSPPVAAADPTAPAAAPDDLSLKPRVERLERQLIREALGRAGGNQTVAARALGLSRFGLQKKLTRYGL